MASSTTQNIGTAIAQAVLPNRSVAISQANAQQSATRAEVQAANHAVAHKLTQRPTKEESKRPTSLKKEVSPLYSPQTLRSLGQEMKRPPQSTEGNQDESPDLQEPIDITA
jgi:hypothetical protein